MPHVRPAFEQVEASFASLRKSITPAAQTAALEKELSGIRPVRGRLVKTVLGATVLVPMYAYFANDFIQRIRGNAAVLMKVKTGVDGNGEAVEYKIDGSLDDFAVLYQQVNQRNEQWWGSVNYINFGESWELARASRVVFALGQVEARLVVLENEMYTLADKNEEIAKYFDLIPPVLDANGFLHSLH
jgi:hypothetical protein